IPLQSALSNSSASWKWRCPAGSFLSSLSQQGIGTEVFRGCTATPRVQTECERRSGMRRHAARLVFVSVFVAAVLIVSCAKSYHDGGERYVFVATNIGLPYWHEAQAGFLDAAKSLGVRAELVGPTAYAP